MKRETINAIFAALIALGVPYTAVGANTTATQTQSGSNRLESLDVVERGGQIYIKFHMNKPLANVPASFSVANPARIAFDFPGTVNALGRNRQSIVRDELRSADIVQAGDRTRVVLNMTKVLPYDTRLEGNDVIIVLTPQASTMVTATSKGSVGNFASPNPKAAGVVPKSVLDVNFRRGTDGEGRVVVQLSDSETGIDIRPQGKDLIVEFLNAQLPQHLMKESDVADFGTPVSTIKVKRDGQNVKMIVRPNGTWEHNAYQSDKQFVLEVRRLVEDPSLLVQGAKAGEFAGEKLSLNFQDIDVRSVLQVIADFTDFNIVTSDSVVGQLTLRLKDVPWDQALDIILQAKGLDMRKNGNVIWIAPSEELATREKLQLESMAQIGDLEPLQTEVFQINYHQAKAIGEFLVDKKNDVSMLSGRGVAVADERSNKLFITDVPSRIQEIASLVQQIDVAPTQVLIEARVVEANKDFGNELGVRLGLGGATGPIVGYNSLTGRPIRQAQFGGKLENAAYRSGMIPGPKMFEAKAPTDVPGGLNVDMAATGGNALSMILWNSAATRFLNLELSAMESDGRGRVISSPRVMTANQVPASIEHGTEIPYLVESASGGTSVKFKKAVLSLQVKPVITPDGRVQLFVTVHKDEVDWSRTVLGVPPIDTRNVQTEVLVDNGGTVVLGGVFIENSKNLTEQVPLLGDLPVVGNLFKKRLKKSEKKELLVFITPKIVSSELTLR